MRHWYLKLISFLIIKPIREKKKENRYFTVSLVSAHGKRASDNNLLVQKLLSTTMRDASDTKDPRIRQPFTSNQWTPTFSGTYDRRSENVK